MATLIQAKWRVTLGDPSAGGVVLLDFGDLLQGEPSLVRSGVAQAPMKGIRLPFATQLSIFNIEHTLSISRVVVCSNDAAARLFLLAHTASLPTSALDCTIALNQSNPASVMTLSAALIQPGFRAETQNNRFLGNYTIIGGALTAPS